MLRCVSFITIVDYGFKTWLGVNHQYDYECNSTGINIGLFYIFLGDGVMKPLALATDNGRPKISPQWDIRPGCVIGVAACPREREPATHAHAHARHRA